jgi:hypothetical protein
VDCCQHHDIGQPNQVWCSLHRPEPEIGIKYTLFGTVGNKNQPIQAVISKRGDAATSFVS